MNTPIQNSRNIPPIPVMEPKETGFNMRPGCACGRQPIPISPNEWTHLIACRFGPPRPVEPSHPVTYSGDSYRYDIFRQENESHTRVTFAIRAQDGGGTIWYVENIRPQRQASLAALISAIQDEAIRWDYCHYLCESLRATAEEASSDAEDAIKVAFVQGRLKKRKKNGIYRVEVIPEMS